MESKELQELIPDENLHKVAEIPDVETENVPDHEGDELIPDGPEEDENEAIGRQYVNDEVRSINAMLSRM